MTSLRHYQREYERFRKLLIRARKDAGLTQHQAAKRLRRSQSYVAKSETGDRTVDHVELKHFAKAYRKSMRYFD